MWLSFSKVECKKNKLNRNQNITFTTKIRDIKKKL